MQDPVPPPPSPAPSTATSPTTGRWGPLTNEMLAQDALRARELRDRHQTAARRLAVCGWALCVVGSCAAAACVVSQALASERSLAVTTVLVSVSGACNALQRVPGPASLAARRYDLALRADQALARCAALLDVPVERREGDPYTTLALINQLIDSVPNPQQQP